ncbi:hypothetical protein BVG16_17915 [Paenibacillus selenitireducens]|jgi:hypothetical protein|uniref:DUF2759 domain-containing protein n=1 Tax=Paenibacillus selenitireducens TaxID=1324314 RepID=A0A1T2X8A7_9BACL|nr:hypothetical protein [Paenibacillus selenitireducens]OPA76094.1 hypothetical protein BVG16_17915 [Paenibacillus selenitireducens]
MLLAEAAEAAKKFEPFDMIMVVVTILLVVALVRLVSQSVKNKFAIAFTSVSLIVFVLADVAMIKTSWL